MWRVRQHCRIALVSRRWQDASGTQGRDGLATNDNRDEAATQYYLWKRGGILKAEGFGDGYEWAKRR
jgi:hypothetical protein